MGTHTLICREVAAGRIDVVDDPFDGGAHLHADVELDGGLVARASATTLIETVRRTVAAHDGETGAMVADAVAEAVRRETAAATARVTLTLTPSTPAPVCWQVRWTATSGETPADCAPQVADAEQDAHAPGGEHEADTASRRAVVSMESASPQAPSLFRDVIVAIDAAPGTQIEGISPLYHAMTADGGETRTAVAALDTAMDAAALTAFLNAASRAHDGDVTLHIVDIDDADGRARIDDGGAGNRAAILAPWMDMDPMATLHGDPLSYLLVSAPDAPFAGLESDHWIIGGAQ